MYFLSLRSRNVCIVGLGPLFAFTIRQSCQIACIDFEYLCLKCVCVFVSAFHYTCLFVLFCFYCFGLNFDGFMAKIEFGIFTRSVNDLDFDMLLTRNVNDFDFLKCLGKT